MDERMPGGEGRAAGFEGANPADFPWVADSYAWAYGCANCPKRNIYSARGMCTEVYCELLTNYSDNRPIGERCPRRE